MLEMIRSIFLERGCRLASAATVETEKNIKLKWAIILLSAFNLSFSCTPDWKSQLFVENAPDWPCVYTQIVNRKEYIQLVCGGQNGVLAIFDFRK